MRVIRLRARRVNQTGRRVTRGGRWASDVASSPSSTEEDRTSWTSNDKH